ncbi:MAG: toprim domain-containing protein [Deltaproteobacteria bacterium]|nr:toprim domain-containing protein [Deltaproteobacteria bacterium]
MIRDKAHAAFRQDCEQAGYTMPDELKDDDSYDRCFSHNRKKKDGWYSLTSNGRFWYGCCRDYSNHLADVNWWSGHKSEVTPEEWAQIQKEQAERKARADARKKESQQEAATLAQKIWSESKPCDSHPYLERKKVQSYGLKIDDQGRLIVQIYGENGGMMSLQRILPEKPADGTDKPFLTGGRTKGGFYTIPGNDKICIAEGYATAASVHEATGATVYVAFYAGNLKSVAQIARRKHPDATITICCDDDRFTDQNPGRIKGQAAATEIGAAVVWPVFADSKLKLTDFNDLAISEGLEVARRQLTEANAPAPKSEKKKKGQADQLIDLFFDSGGTLFHDSEKNGYATLKIKAHFENYPLRSRHIKLFLSKAFRSELKKTPNSQAVKDAIDALDAMAVYDFTQCSTYVRVGGSERDVLYIDLGGADWRVVKITIDGYDVISDCPIKFIRPSGLLELPEPVPGGSLHDLRPQTNIRSEKDWILFLACLIDTLRMNGPKMILILQGGKGSGKTTASWSFRGVIDPNVAMLRVTPRDERDLVIAGQNSLICCFDNCSGIQVWLSDGFCRLSTGAGLSTRRLYTDNEEMLFSLRKMVLLNGIDQIATRGDLADRAIVITLPSLTEANYRPDDTIKSEFQAILPGVLGSLFTVVSHAMKNLPTTTLSHCPRMSDFAHFIVASESAGLWQPGQFLEVYLENRDEATTATIESDVVAQALLKLVSKESDWVGTTADLLSRLDDDQFCPEPTRRSKSWPRTPEGLSNRISRCSTELSRCGVIYDANFGRRDGRKLKRLFLDNSERL